MPSQSIPRWRPLPDGARYVADSDPESLCHHGGERSGQPNVAAIARAARLNKAALGRVFNGTQPWAGGDTVLRVSNVAAKARGIPVEDAQRNIFEPVDVEVAP